MAQKQQDADYLYPDKTCAQYRTLAERSCGGTSGVKNFGCTEGASGKHVTVECVNDGYYEMAPDWDSLGQQFEGDDLNPDADDIEGTGTSTGSHNIGSSTTSGGGDTGPEGEGTDSDADGDIDGYQMGDRSLDYGPLLNATSNIASRFPFSIVSTFKNMGESFTAQGQCPSFTLPVWNQVVHFDLCAFNGVASLIRNLFSFILTAACFWGLIKFFM